MMAEPSVEGIRARVLDAVAQVLGYPLDPETRNLSDLNSLQILELLVLLEEEFDIDSDEIIEARPEWWISLDEIVASIAVLSGEKQQRQDV
jgi:acyl carrier protein